MVNFAVKSKQIEMLLSIIIPAYNSNKRVETVIAKLKKVKIKGVRLEIIVVDDASKDDTYKRLKKIRGILLIHHQFNTGKGGAVKTGLQKAKGDILFIQDDDMEYNPSDIPKIVAPIIRKQANVVFGSRRMKKSNSYSSFLYYVGGVFVDWIINFILQSKTTDAITGSKAFTREVYNKIKPIQTKGFEIEAEIAAKVIKNHGKIKEVAISYNPRTHKEGKNIRWHHAFPIFKTLIKYAWFY